MDTDEGVQQRAEAARDLNRHEKRTDGDQVVASLVDGLTILRGSLFVRIHGEVEKMFGVDSMLVPISELKTKRQSDRETELYQVAECTVAARQGGYVAGVDEWFPGWLARLRLGLPDGDVELPRIREYLSLSADDRRLMFTDVLARVVPESRRAPLVLFRLLPLAVHLATHAAFGNRVAADRVRVQQKSELPSIDDCPKCRGKVLAYDLQCTECGNPLWKSHLLTVAD
jgi:hypothetical protein